MKDKILAAIDFAIATLSQLVSIIPGKIDDLALSFLKWARNDETFLNFLENFEPDDNAMMEVPAPVVESLRRWREAEGVEVSPGGYMELLGYILQIIRWIQSRKAEPPAS